MDELRREYAIDIYHTYSEHKSAIIERFNRTLKEMMWKYFTANSTHRWIDVIQDLVDQYNNRKHRTIGMSPNEALEHEEELLEAQHKRVQKIYNTKTSKPKFKVGDYVRISRIKGPFEKGYHINWSREVYRVYEVDDKFPYTYKLIDDLGNVIKGSFYEQELQKTSADRTREVEKILAKRVVNGETQYLVKYLGYSDEHNEWISAKDFDPTFLKRVSAIEGGEYSELLGYVGETPVRRRKESRPKRQKKTQTEVRKRSTSKRKRARKKTVAGSTIVRYEGQTPVIRRKAKK